MQVLKSVHDDLTRQNLPLWFHAALQILPRQPAKLIDCQIVVTDRHLEAVEVRLVLMVAFRLDKSLVELASFC